MTFIFRLSGREITLSAPNYEIATAKLFQITGRQQRLYFVFEKELHCLSAVPMKPTEMFIDYCRNYSSLNTLTGYDTKTKSPFIRGNNKKITSFNYSEKILETQFFFYEKGNNLHMVEAKTEEDADNMYITYFANTGLVYAFKKNNECYLVKADRTKATLYNYDLTKKIKEVPLLFDRESSYPIPKNIYKGNPIKIYGIQFN